MAYDSDKKPLELTALTTLATDDTVIVGDTSDTTEVAKSITWANIKTLIEAFTSYFNVTTGTTDDITEGATNLYFLSSERSKLTGIETGADVTDATNVNAAGATMNTDTDVSANGYVLDEDDMASDSATQLATQQSIKAYVDSASVDALVVSAKVNEIAGITAGQVVYLSGATGGFPQVSLASNDDYTKSDVLAIANETKTNGQTIAVTLSGIVDNLDTTAFTEGQLLYLGTTGNITTTHPTGLDAVVRIGRAIQINVSTGSIGFVVDSLTEVDTVDDFMRNQLVNTSTGTSAVTNTTLINDADHYVSLNINGSNSSFGASEGSLFNKGYGDFLFINDGNKAFEWYTDVTDVHTGAYTRKMVLNADGKLETDSQAITVDDTANVVGLTVTQNDITNNPTAVAVVNTGSGDTLSLDNYSTGKTIKFLKSGAETGSITDVGKLTLGVNGWVQLDGSQGSLSLETSLGVANLLSIKHEGTSGVAILADRNNNGIAIYADKDVTNANNTTTAQTIDHTSVVDDAGTYTKTGAALQINSNVTETSGTITDSAQVLDINQTHADATGNVVDIANEGSGSGLYIESNNYSGKSIEIKQDGGGATAVYVSSGDNVYTEDLVHMKLKNGTDSGNCLKLENLGTGSHMNLTGDSGNASPTEGDLWRESDGLKYFDGTTEHNMIHVTAPATATSTGVAGDRAYDASYLYICTATNTWKRVAIATW